DRRILSQERAQQAWHQLLGRDEGAGNGAASLIGLAVDPLTPAQCNLVEWSSAALEDALTAATTETPPVARILDWRVAFGSQADISVRLWDGESNPSVPAMEYRRSSEAGWHAATLTKANGQPWSGAALSAAFAGTTHHLAWDSVTDLGSDFTGTIFLRARAADGLMTGAWSEPVQITIDLLRDLDGDGIPEGWEFANGLDPQVPDSMADLDRDGITNLMEFALGLNPRISSLVGMPVAGIENGYLTLTVTRNPAAAATVRFTVQVSSDLGTWLSGPADVTILEDNPARLKARDNTPVSSSPRRFARLQVMVQNPTAPTLTLHPVGSRIVMGTSTTLNAGAQGWPIPNFQWESRSPGGSFQPVPGATGVSYTTPSLTADTEYRVIVTNSQGSVASDFTLIHVAPEVGSISPLSYGINDLGGTYVISITSEFTGPWTIGDLPPWISIAPSPGNDWTQMRVTVQPNTTPAIRTATFTIGGLAHDMFQPPSGMAYIAAGSFEMGQDGIATPVHSVDVSAFYMGKYEVTKEEWDEVRAWGLNNGYTDLAVGNGGFASKGANHPAHSISWYDMVKWCNARSQQEGLTLCYTVSGETYKTGSSAPDCNWSANGYRLPSEAEWEKAARGRVTGKNFPWGTDTISHSQANYMVYSSNGTTNDYSYDVTPRPPATGNYYYHPSYTAAYPYSSPVGSFAPNGYGLYDMAGNSREWCWDWVADYPSTSQTDPHGAASGLCRVQRGGSWADSAYGCRVAFRNENAPSITSLTFGFRVARSSVP
ncbi:MAG: SUMF1/EgtB/PvdO family nonheme iron enzyme, partial [Verrucomicrobia bacterium]|nr:SUMF1/EgtB/PvdO family nonheme iron enzyme [Verrucomicrobiota bacterium]